VSLSSIALAMGSGSCAIVLVSAAFAGMHGFALVGGSTVGNALVLVLLLWPALVFGTSYVLE
ncbi:hypothetical protein, partial [Klebsiella aerogenes]|uniref:hypothetical protein n=1 Tax=Klebsiella aerogenes TaxID=548 RepID=UPI001954F170